MTPAAKQLFDFLLADIEATASTTYATALLTAAKAQITAGGGSLAMVESGSVGSKNFSSQTVCTALDVASAARAALNAYDTGVDSEPTGLTFIDFSGSLPTSC